MKTRCLLLVAAVASCFAVATPTPEDFAKSPEVLGARISPTGEYLAVLRILDDKRVVVVLTYPGLELKGVMNFPGRNQVLTFQWVSNDRLIGSVTRDFGRYEFLAPSGELFGMDADGGRSKHLFGYRAGEDTPSATRGAVRRLASATIIDPLWDDKNNVLIQIRDWNWAASSAVEAAKMNVYTGRLTARVRALTPDAFLVAGRDGDVRFSLSTDDDFNSVVHVRDPEKGDWHLLSKTTLGDVPVSPLAVAKDGRLFVSTAPDDGPLGVYLLDPATGRRTEVYRHAVVDARLVEDYKGNAWGVRIEPDYPTIVAIDPDNPEAALLTQLRTMFEGRFVSIANTTHDGQLVLVGVRDDNQTPEVFLFDRKTRQMQRLFDALPWIDDASLSEMRPVQFKARDGVVLRGYLTLPRDQAGPAPMVLMPHGGPHGPRDSWGYDPYVQVLAVNGYAVLQVNYRGSGGYGTRFERIGYREWAGAMQDDLTDATRWAIETGITEAGRVCIHGWSYGGYAALMSVVREPDLYACSVPAAGVYDHDIQYKKADFARATRWGKKYIDRVIGPTAEDRRRASPITYLDRLKTPLFIVHGEEDARVPVDHARELRKRLKAAGIEARYMEKENEGHGFFKEENRADFFNALLAFLDEHIGAAAPPRPAPPAEAAQP